MAKKEVKNRWSEHHDFLEKQSKSMQTSQATKSKEEIMRLCGWSMATFHRKLKNPSALSIAEKTTVANVYNMPVHFLFPELETMTA